MIFRISLYISTLALLSIISGCSSDFKKHIQNKADSALITCYHRPGKAEKKIKLTSKKQIAQLVNYISATSSPFYKCGYNGSIDFTRNNKSILSTKIEFNTHPGCTHIIYIHQDTIFSKKITAIGTKTLRSLCKADQIE